MIFMFSSVMIFFEIFSLSLQLKVILNDEFGGKEDSFRVAAGSLKNRTLEFVFEEFIDKAGSEGAEYLVLPELSLKALPEAINVGSTPCDTFDEHSSESTLYKSSCAAKRNHIYVTYTMVEIGEKCKEVRDPLCWYDSHYLYNTAVVFGRNGTIITKYRKRALFPPDTLILKPGTGDPTYFITDFGVKIGIFICFEIFTHRPAYELVKDLGINHIGFPTKFHDFIPITSLGMQQAFSEFFSVSFIAANNLASEGDVKSSGSGIYYAGKPLSWTSEHEDVLLVADLPINSFQKIRENHDTISPNDKKKILKNTGFSKGDDQDDDEKTEFFKSEPGLSKSVQLSIPQVDCRISFTIDTVSSTSEEPEYFVAYVAARKFTYEKLFPTNLTSYICVLLNCGRSEGDCEKGIKSQFLKNTRSTTTFSQLDVDVDYNFDVDSIFPLKNTDEKKLFDWGSFQFDYDVQKNQAQISSTSVLKDQPVLFVGLGYFDLGL